MSTSKAAGFTLVELMIVVALIGILSSVAIPGFFRYRNQTKTAEADFNLVALAKAEKSYYAEFGTFISVLGEPFTTLGVAPNSDTRDSGSVKTAFLELGWYPEGGVYFDYDACAPGGAGCICPCVLCFTVAAWGDLDDDLAMSGFMYFEPDVAGDTCLSAIGGHFPPVDGGGNEILGSASWHGATDDF